jgi:hypothetical protein
LWSGHSCPLALAREWKNMLEILLEFIGEIVLDGLCAFGDHGIQELLKWTRDLI